jgi:hypothetical protein
MNTNCGGKMNRFILLLAVIVAGCQGTKESKEMLDELEDAKVRLAEARIKSLTVAAVVFQLNNDRWPQSLQELASPQPGGGKALIDQESLLDPWGKPYRYDASGPQNKGEKPDIWCVTPERKTIGNWPK